MFPVIGLPCSANFSTGRGGFLQSLSMTLSPCCPYYPAEVSRRISPLRRSMLPSPKARWLGLRSANSRGHLWVHFVTARRLAHHPTDGCVIRPQESRFPSSLLLKLQGFDFYPGGTHLPLITPAFAGHTLFHSQLHAGLSRRTPQPVRRLDRTVSVESVFYFARSPC